MKKVLVTPSERCMYATLKFTVYGMIDTIRLKIPVKNVDKKKLYTITHQKEGEIRYKLYKDVISVGSYSSTLNLFINNSDDLFLEFSVPKFLYGHNLKYAYFKDIIPVLIQIKMSVDKLMTTPPIMLWHVQRVDICEYIYTKNAYDDIYLYQTLSYPRKKKYLYDTSVMFVGNSYSTKFYIKEEEFFKNDFKQIVKYDISKAYSLLNESKFKIRIETSYRKKALQDILKKKQIFVSDLLDNKPKICNHFKKIQKKLYGNIDPEKMKQQNLLKELKKHYKNTRALQLYSFFVFYYADEPNKKIVQDMYSRSQIYRNLKSIENVLNY